MSSCRATTFSHVLVMPNNVSVTLTRVIFFTAHFCGRNSDKSQEGPYFVSDGVGQDMKNNEDPLLSNVQLLNPYQGKVSGDRREG